MAEESFEKEKNGLITKKRIAIIVVILLLLGLIELYLTNSFPFVSVPLTTLPLAVQPCEGNFIKNGFGECISVEDLNRYPSDIQLMPAKSYPYFWSLLDTPESYTGQSGRCLQVNSDENALIFSGCGAGGTTYTGISPIDINSDTNVIRLDLNSQSNWIGVFRGQDGNFYLNFSNSTNRNFSLLSLDDNSSFDSRYILFTDSNNFSRLIYQVIVDWNQAVLNSNNWYQFDSNWQNDFGVFDANLRQNYYRQDDLNSNGKFILTADSNNFARLYFEVIADWNDVVKYSVDWNALGITDDVNSWINALTFGSADFNNSYITYDGNIYSLGIFEKDTNALLIDFNVGGKNVFNANDLNVNQDINAGNNIYAGNCYLFSDGTQLCSLPVDSNTTDTTLDTNSGAETSWLGKPHYFSVVQRFLRINSWDLNVGSGKIGFNDLNYSLADLNWSVQSQCSGDTNSVLTSAGLCQFIGGFGAGGGGIDTNIFSANLMEADSNSWKVDINAGGNDLFNVNDINATGDVNIIGDVNIVGDLNVWGNLIVDGNITAQTPNGFVVMAPDQNLLCVGSDPNLRACILIKDQNALFGFGV